MLRPFASFRERLLVCRAERFVVGWGVRDRASDGIQQTFEHADRGWHLAWG
jgi:ribosome biogenesis protein Nip4